MRFHKTPLFLSFFKTEKKHYKLDPFGILIPYKSPCNLNIASKVKLLNKIHECKPLYFISHLKIVDVIKKISLNNNVDLEFFLVGIKFH